MLDLVGLFDNLHKSPIDLFSHGNYNAKNNIAFSASKSYLIYLILGGIYLLIVDNRNSRTRCEICSKLTIKIPERYHWRRSGIFIVNFEHISHLVLVFLLLTLNM